MTELATAKLSVKALRRSYDNTHAVSDIDFQINQGEFVVLLGPSGCGKSTTLKMVAGLETPCSGSVELDGRDITHLPPGKRQLAMVFQSYALFPHLSVAENILFGLKARRTPADIQQSRLADVVALVNLSDHLHKKPSQLSGGQCQRVALARAIVAEAPLCLMDEPLSNLDAKLRNDMRAELRAIQRRLGMTLLYVTHDQVEAMSMADQIILMNQGEIVQSGSPQALYNNPASTFVAQFIGSPPMNLMNADNLILGVRPEHIHRDINGYPASVVTCDYHGADTIIEVELHDFDQQRIKLRHPGHLTLVPGSAFPVSWEKQYEHYFSCSDGQRINAPQTHSTHQTTTSEMTHVQAL
ncbi:MAG: ABC transporter ATP-binding protein [Amphritea sp.]|nr:ABC transporter ATP-binding protein [Amphritea sp.]